jgi:hypothetical protein
MMSEGKIAEAEIGGDFGHGFAERCFAFDRPDIPHKCVYTIEHSPLRLRRDLRRRCSKSLSFPRTSFQPRATPSFLKRGGWH